MLMQDKEKCFSFISQNRLYLSDIAWFCLWYL